MLNVDEAQRIVLESVSALPAQQMPLLQAIGCTIAERLTASVSLPPFDNSAMDGYAVIAQDTRGATAEAPCALKVLEDLPAGTAPAREVQPGTAARIMTGAPLPAGADAVVMVEDARPGTGATVEVLREAKRGDNIRPAGEDIEAGQVALSPGELLGPGELGLAAALGCTHVVAVRRPRVAIVTTGSELVEPGQALRPGAIYNSNRVTLAGLVLSAGAEIADCLHVEDEPKAVEDALARCPQSDILLTTGGVSVGEYDFVKVALERLGEIKFWRVAMKPGKPVAFGNVLGRPLFGLPGNPVSALVTFAILVAPALRRMAGRRDCLPTTVQATLLSDLPHKPARREFVQGRARWSDDNLVVEASSKRGSAMLTSTVGANCLVVIPEDSKGLRAGEKAQVILLQQQGAAL